MSHENSADNLKSVLPKITYGEIYQLLSILEADFKANIEKESWLNSQNSTAVLIKNIDILYQDLTKKYFDADPNNDEAIYEKIKDKHTKSASKKVLILVFKWADKAPQALEFLKKKHGEILISQLKDQFLKKQQRKAAKFGEGLVCIDSVISDASPAFKAFVGKAKNIFISTNKRQIEKLVLALEKPDFYKDKIFQHPHALYYAMAACYQGKISPEQYNIFSQWLELKKAYGPDKVIVHRLLDDYGRFTKEAEEMILKFYKNNIPESFEDPFITKDNLETLRRYFLKLPESEQIFISLNSSDQGYNYDLKINWEATEALAIVGEKDLKNLSFFPLTAYQCFIKTVFPEHPATLKARLGPIDREDIEASHLVNECVVSTYYKRPSHLHTPSSNRYFHKAGAKTTTAVGIHDFFHGLMLSSVNEKALKALQKTPSIVREALKIKWSTGIWTVADAPFININGTEKAESTSAFIGVLHTTYPIMFQQTAEYLPEVASILMDLYFAPQKWSSYINTEKFSMELLRLNCLYWKVLKKYDGFFNLSDNPKLNLLKFGLIYKAVQLNESEESIISILFFCDRYIQKNTDKLEKNVDFKMATGIFRQKTEEEKEEDRITETYALLTWNKKELNHECLYDICLEIRDNDTDNEMIEIVKTRLKKETQLLIHLFDSHFDYFVKLANSGMIDVNQPINDKNETLFARAVKFDEYKKIDFLKKFKSKQETNFTEEKSFSIKETIDASFFGKSLEDPLPNNRLDDFIADNTFGNIF